MNATSIQSVNATQLGFFYNDLDAGGINVDNEGFESDGSPSSILGYAVQSDPDHPGSLDLFFPGRKYCVEPCCSATMCNL